MSGEGGIGRAIEASGVLLVPCARPRLAELSRAVLACALLGASIVVAGCGQKGPLVLPDTDSAGASAPPSNDEGDDEDERPATGDRNGTENGADGP
jgi:predicted small lipoprotein YifL